MTAASPGSVLVVDDDRAVGEVVRALLTQDGLHARWVGNAAEALELLDREVFDAVLTDVRMPGLDGMALLERLKARWPELPVVVMTAHGTVPMAVEAMKKGAAEFVLKPFDREELLYVLRKAVSSGRESVPRAALSGAPVLGRSEAMRAVWALLDKAAPTTATVLLRGESGTGKEVAAQALHQKSGRPGPLVVVHCAALPEALLESELFGYEKGAFTGASSRKPGRVELAQGGTLFLDEMGDVPLTTQVKLLRLLQQRSYERVGGTQTLTADVRFVAATHRDLEAMVADGRFREDLYHRLNVIPVWLPPLRERREDVAELARQFAKELGAQHGRPAFELAPPLLEWLGTQSWPGNVRELQNFLERLVVLSDQDRPELSEVQRIQGGALGRALRVGGAAPYAGAPSSAEDPGSLDESRRRAEKEALVEALARAKGQRTLAAKLLGVSRRTLYNKLAEHQVS